MPEEDLVELKFRLYDGTDIGPIRYSSASTVSMLKERIVSDWPKGYTMEQILVQFDILPLLQFRCLRNEYICSARLGC
ncbi:hypothetical protein MKW94_012040 [Papaver nudicaule]|uniref:UBL3-like ubiquitin domain-containing protein n=1 Tax=Papaver nudicaule TaxID=74823 RepID=A0AA41VBF4_PAPNU|nr:hypothetical protein [Papaver nudicaule]